MLFWQSSEWLFLDSQACEALTVDSVKKDDIKDSHGDKLVVELSGGNQQQSHSRALDSSMIETKMLILDAPTKGLTSRTKAEFIRWFVSSPTGHRLVFISSS
jgi:ABC-type sugar transport system ATPase subunit